MLSRLAAKYGIPAEVMRFVEIGLLKTLREDEAQRTVEFHLAKYNNGHGQTATFALTWIHPDVKEQFDRRYVAETEDLPNFFVTRNAADAGDEEVDGLETVDDLLAWLGAHAVARTSEACEDCQSILVGTEGQETVNGSAGDRGSGREWRVESGERREERDGNGAHAARVRAPWRGRPVGG